MIYKIGFKNSVIMTLIILVLIMFFIWQNNAIEITKYSYVNSKIPKDFNGYSILQISDLHNKDFNGRLVEKVKETEPNIIVITGDLIDRRNTKINIAIEFIEEISKVAPIYFVSGNHEQLSRKYILLKEKLGSLNVEIIDNSYRIFKKGNSEIGLLGLADPSIEQSEETYLWSNDIYYIKNNLEGLLADIDTDFNILLSHRPEQFNIYKEKGVNLVFSGHAHGGQIRLPFIGGLFAPGQGVLPKYTSGIYSESDTSMVVSRGLGNSIFPLRIFNRPELVVVTLKRRHI